MIEVSPNKSDIGLAPVLEGLLKGARPGLLFGEQQAARGLKVQPVNWVDMLSYLVPDPLKASLRLGVVGIAMHQQARGLGNHDPLGGLCKDWKMGSFWHRGD